MTSVEDSECVGYALKHKIGHSVDQVKVLVREDRRIIVRNVANMWISFGPCDHILKKDSIVISFPPYLTNLVPCEFSFPRTQDCIKGEEIL